MQSAPNIAIETLSTLNDKITGNWSLINEYIAPWGYIKLPDIEGRNDRIEKIGRMI